MNYRDVRTVHTGIWLWMSGFSNRKEEKQINYIPKKLDINQKENFVRDAILGFVKGQGIIDEVTKEVKKKYHFNTIKYSKIVQDKFPQFVEYIRNNYEPQK
jgi:uncharacterized protein YfaT (DUF1175 family)